jgi:hypothetical protein
MRLHMREDDGGQLRFAGLLLAEPIFHARFSDAIAAS